MAQPGGFSPGRILTALRERLANPRPVMESIGVHLVSRAKRAFQEQKRGKTKWRARKVPNVAGVVHDLMNDKVPPMKRLDATPAGIDTGRLMMDISHRVTRDNVVEVGSMLPYASLINYGGKSIQPWSEAGKVKLRELLYGRSRVVDKTGKAAERKHLDRSEEYQAAKLRHIQWKIHAGATPIWKGGEIVGAKGGRATRETKESRIAMNAVEARVRASAPGGSSGGATTFGAYERDFRWLLADDVNHLETNVPPRPFIGIDSEDREDILGIVKRAFVGAKSFSASISHGGSTTGT